MANTHPGHSRQGLLSIADLKPADIRQLVDGAARLKQGLIPDKLQGRIVALLFEKPSLRTRVSFEVAMEQLGGKALYLSPAEVGLGQREQVPDVARTLSRYVNGIIARTYSHHTLETLAQYATVPVVNALSELEHPCQALGDLLTIYEKKGARKLAVAFIGDGNNVSHSLLLVCAAVGADFCIACPPGYEPRPDVWRRAAELAAASGARLSQVRDPREAARGADVVYTDVWISMGQDNEAAVRRAAFAGYQVSPQLMSLAARDAIFMHPLPAHHGEEVVAGMLDHPQSVVFDQAENRLHIQKAILLRLLQ